MISNYIHFIFNINVYAYADGDYVYTAFVLKTLYLNSLACD